MYLDVTKHQIVQIYHYRKDQIVLNQQATKPKYHIPIKSLK